MLQKVPTISKNASIKSCSNLNFLQKMHWEHIFISPRSRATGCPTLDMYWNGKVGWMVPKVPIIYKITSVELIGSADSSLQWLILLIFHNVFFWSYTVKISEILGDFAYFKKISDCTTTFLDENWSSIVKKKV